MEIMTMYEGRGLGDTSKGEVTPPKKGLVLQLFNTDMGSFHFMINHVLTMEIYSNGYKCCLLLY